MAHGKNRMRRMLSTFGLLIGAGVLLFTAYQKYERSPWTRHGLVKADIVSLAPQVNGEIAQVFVTDNQGVQKGTLLFAIDKRPYTLARDRAQTDLQRTRQDVAALEVAVDIAAARLKSAKASYIYCKRDKERIKVLFENDSVSQKSWDAAVRAFDEATSRLEASRAELARAKVNLGSPGETNVRIQGARLRLEQAELNLSYTEVRSPVNGHVVNVNISPGDYAVAGRAVMAVVDRQSIHVMAAFKETQLKSIRVGSPAKVTLMSMPDTPLTGEVKSIGRAIDPGEFKASESLVPSLPAAFDWVRLAQRVPVEIRITSKVQDPRMIPGTTTSVAITPTPSMGG